MSQVIPSIADCCSPCAETTTTNIPGPQGEAGENGLDGVNGTNAFTFVASNSPAAQPVMPAEGAQVTVNTTTSTAFVQPNQYVYVAFWGTMKVFSVPSATSLILINPENSATGAYAENAAPGTSLPALSRITVTAQQGPTGIIPGGALMAANNLSDLALASTARTNLGLTSGATAVVGRADTNIPPVDQAGGLTNGNMVRATANGVESISAATARTAMGLGTMATQDASAVAISGGTLNGTLGGTTPAAASVTTLGTSGAATIGGAASVAGDLTASAKVFTPSSAIQSLLAATPINPNAGRIRVAGSGLPVTLTAIPTITNPGVDGQRLLIMGTSDANAVTLQDEATLAGSKLNLGAATRALGKGDILDLVWDATDAAWYEVTFTDN